MIEPYMPEDGHCDDCGSINVHKVEDYDEFMYKLDNYSNKKDELLGFYNKVGNLIDFELKNGYESYDDLKLYVQHNIKH